MVQSIWFGFYGLLAGNPQLREGRSPMQKILVFARGRSLPGKGGTGFEMFVRKARERIDLTAGEVVGAVSDLRGGTQSRAQKLGIPFFSFYPDDADPYKSIISNVEPDLCIFLGWPYPVEGIEPSRAIAVHRGMRGGSYANAHALDAQLYMKGGVIDSVVSINFVVPNTFPDVGPLIIEVPVPIRVGEDIQPVTRRRHHGTLEGTPEERLARIVKRGWKDAMQSLLPAVAQHVLSGLVRWNKDAPLQPIIPPGYARFAGSIDPVRSLGSRRPIPLVSESVRASWEREKEQRE